MAPDKYLYNTECGKKKRADFIKRNILQAQPLTPLRKIASILFLLLIVASQVGYYLMYAFRQHQIKEAVNMRMLAGIPDSSLQLIVAYENESFHWEEEGKEFYMDGQLYDVVRLVRKSKQIILYCINDKKENELLTHIGKAVKSGNNKDTKHTLSIQVIDLLMEDISPTVPIDPPSTQSYFSFVSAITAFSKKVNAPPPRG